MTGQNGAHERERPHPLGLSRSHALNRRRGRYNVAKLIEQYGDAKLPDLLHELAKCPKAQAHSIHERLAPNGDPALIEEFIALAQRS